jgi:hypothetical protein
MVGIVKVQAYVVVLENNLELRTTYLLQSPDVFFNCCVDPLDACWLMAVPFLKTKVHLFGL